MERSWGNLFCTRAEKKEIIGTDMTSEWQKFSLHGMSVAIKKMKENKASDESGVTAE